MIPNISLSRPSLFRPKRRLIVLENYYEQLKPYFTSKKKQEVNPIITTSFQENKNALERENLRSQIEENQILYSQLLAERLLKIKTA